MILSFIGVDLQMLEGKSEWYPAISLLVPAAGQTAGGI